MVGGSDWGEANRELVLHGDRASVWVEEDDGHGWCGWWRNNANVLTAPKLYT